MNVKPYNICSLFSSLVALMLSLEYYILRIGFDRTGDNSLFTLFKILSLSWFILLLPGVYKSIKKSANRAKDASGALILLMGLILVIAAGKILALTGINLLYLFMLGGTVFFLAGLWDFFRQARLTQVILGVLMGAGFAFWLGGMLWGQEYSNPLLFEGIACGLGHVDTFFHVSLASMIKTYGIVSTGLHGLPFVPYHTGSHWIFAQLSGLLGIRVLTFYQLAYPVIFVPLLVNSMLILILAIRQAVLKNDNQGILNDLGLWLSFLILQIGFVPLLITECFMNTGRIHYTCESYVVSIIFSLLLFCIILHLFARSQSQDRICARELGWLLYLLPLAIAVIAFCKISVGFLVLGAGAYMYLRLACYRDIHLTLCGLFCLIGFALVLGMNMQGGSSINYAGDSLSLNLLNSTLVGNLRSLPATIMPFYPYIFYWSSLLFLVMRLFQERIFTLGDFFEALKRKEIMDVEILLVFCVLGALPGMLLFISFGGDGYFSDFQGLMAIILLMAYWPRSFSSVPEQSTPHNLFGRFKLIYILLIPFIITVLLNDLALGGRALKSNLVYRMAVVNHAKTIYSFDSIIESVSSRDPLKTIKHLSPLFSAENLQKCIRRSDQNRVMGALLYLNRLPLKEKKRSLLYVANTQEYWYRLPKRKHVPFLFTAVTEIGQIEGLPPFGDRGGDYYRGGYGYGSYQLRSKPAERANFKVPTLCAKTKKLGFSELLVLNSVTGDIKKYDCGKP